MKQKAFSTSLLLIIATCHLYALTVFGATFWVDSSSYIGIASVLQDPVAAARYFDFQGLFFWSYVPFGVPYIWTALSTLPDAWRWPVLAGFQHALAGFATFVCFYNLNRAWPSRVHLLFCLVLSALPFYQSLHNALLTESISSSLLLLLTGLAVRMLHDEKRLYRQFLWFCLTTLALAWFRGHFVLVAGVMMCAVLWRQRRLLSWLSPAFVAILVLAVLTTPLFRYAISGTFYMPHVGLPAIPAGLWVNPHPSTEALQELSKIPFPPGWSAADLLERGGDWQQIGGLFQGWRNAGRSNSEIMEFTERIGSILRNDGAGVLFNRISYALVSSGFLLPYRLGPPSYEVFRGMTLREQFEHQLAHYRFLSWILTPRAIYAANFAPYFIDAKDANLRAFGRSWAQYDALDRFSDRYRDPFYIGRLWPDVWFLMGVTAITVLLCVNWPLGVIVLAPLAINFAATFAVPYGSIRYAYAVVAVDIVGFSLMAGVLAGQTWRQRMGWRLPGGFGARAAKDAGSKKVD